MKSIWVASVRRARPLLLRESLKLHLFYPRAVRGTAVDVNALQNDAIQYSVDVTGRTPGTYELSVQFTEPEKIEIIGTVQCRVTVTQAATPVPSTPEPSLEPPEPTILPSASPEPTATEEPTL